MIAINIQAAVEMLKDGGSYGPYELLVKDKDSGAYIVVSLIPSNFEAVKSDDTYPGF